MGKAQQMELNDILMGCNSNLDRKGFTQVNGEQIPEAVDLWFFNLLGLCPAGRMAPNDKKQTTFPRIYPVIERLARDNGP
jgi:hypothetical protein